MNYIYTLLKRVIEGNNPNVSKEELNLLLMNFLTTAEIDQAQFDELHNLNNPVEQATTV